MITGAWEVIGVRTEESAIEIGVVEIVKMRSLACREYMDYAWAQARFPAPRRPDMIGAADKTGTALGTLVRMYNYQRADFERTGYDRASFDRTDYERTNFERTNFGRTDMTYTGSCR